MKHKMIEKLIAASMVASSIVSAFPAKTLAAGVVNYYVNGQSAGSWVKQNDRWYYVINGQPQKGWIFNNNQWYYADNAGVMQTGIIQIDRKIYSFAQNGQLQLNNIVINGIVYQVGSDGALVGDNLPVPSKAFDWNVTNDNVVHPSNTVDTSKNTHSDDPYVAYDPVAPKETYQVTFRDDDGEDLRIRNVKDKDTISLYTPTKKGYTFVEWNTKKNGNGDSYDAGDEIKITKDMTLYAVWDEVEVTDENAEALGVVKVTDISVSSANNAKTITESGGTLQFSAEALPVDADNKKVTWSVESETGEATISSDGLLTAKSNGVVKVTATAADGSGVSDSMRITISGQNSGSSSESGGTSSESGSSSTGSGSTGSESQIAEITGDDLVISNTTSTSALTGNTYGNIRVSTNSSTDKTLTNIKANTLVVNGGGKIILDNCKINYLEILRPTSTCEIILKNGSTVAVTNVSRGVALSGSGYDAVNIDTTEVVTINGSVTTANLDVLKSKVKLNGSVTTMNILDDADNSIIEGTGSIGTLNNKATNVKLAVGSIGTIKGEVTNTDLNGLIDQAALLEKYTKLVEEAEKTNTVDSTVKQFICDKADEEDNPYKSDWENLEFRITQLETNNNNKSELAEARNYVVALEKMADLDPTSSATLKVVIPTSGDAVTVDVSGTGADKKIDDVLEEAKSKVNGLTPGLNERTSLLDRIADVETVMEKSKKIKTMSLNVGSESFQVSDYNAIGITNVTEDYLPMVNKFVAQLSKSDYVEKLNSGEFLTEYPSALPQDNRLLIVNTISNDLSLIKKQVNSAIQYQNTVVTINTKLDSAYNYISANGLDSTSGVNDISILNTFKSNLTDIKSLMNIIDANIESESDSDNVLRFVPETMIKISDDVLYSDLTARYNDYVGVLQKNSVKFIDNKFNLLYSKTLKIVNEGQIGESYKTVDANGDVKITKPILPTITETDISNANTYLNTMKGVNSSSGDLIKYKDFFTDEQLQNYTLLCDDVKVKYAEMNNVLAAMKGKVKLGSSIAVQSGNSYTVTVSTSNLNSSYSVDTNGEVTLTSGSTAPVFSVNTTENKAYYTPVISVDDSQYTVSPLTLTNVNIADITPAVAETTETPAVAGRITFDTGNLEYINSVTITSNADSSILHQFAVSMTNQVINNNYVVTMTVTLVY